MSGGDKPDSSLDGPSRQAQVPTTSESDEPYYPMGSEMSLRPTTPRFIVEEVSSINCDNYEPIMVARDASNSTQVYSDKVRNLIIMCFLNNLPNLIHSVTN